MNKVYGKLTTEYMETSSGIEIDIDIFETKLGHLKNAGFNSGDDFFNYIMSVSNDTEVAEYSENYMILPIKAYQFKRRDGYNTVLKVDGNMYHYY